MPNLANSLTLSHFIVYTPDNWKVWFFNMGPFFAPCFCNFLINFCLFSANLCKSSVALFEGSAPVAVSLSVEDTHREFSALQSSICCPNDRAHHSQKAWDVLIRAEEGNFIFFAATLFVSRRPDNVLTRTAFYALNVHILLAVKVVIELNGGKETWPV